MEWANRPGQVIRSISGRVRTFLPVAVIMQGLAALQVLAFEIQVTEEADHFIFDELNFAALRIKASFQHHDSSTA